MSRGNRASLSLFPEKEQSRGKRQDSRSPHTAGPVSCRYLIPKCKTAPVLLCALLTNKHRDRQTGPPGHP